MNDLFQVVCQLLLDYDDLFVAVVATILHFDNSQPGSDDETDSNEQII